MTNRKPMTKVCVAAVVGVTALLAMTGSAFAGVADYTNTSSFSVPNNTGQAGIPQPVSVPPGRTPVQGVELTNVMPSYGGGGGTDLSLRLTGPNGTSVDVIGAGCNIYPNTSAFTISDSAALAISNPAFCTALQANPTTASGRPAQPLSTFNGIPSAGVGTSVAAANKKAQKKGKGAVTLTATDETGGTATTTVNAKTLKTKPKK